MRDVAYAMPDSVPHLFVSSMIWKSVHVQLRKNFVICVVKRKGEHVLQQPSCLRYEEDDFIFILMILYLDNNISMYSNNNSGGMTDYTWLIIVINWKYGISLCL